jgi:GT2 family glycosyltransferase/glycosyltransferase involved in cell wall biosynthesis
MSSFPIFLQKMIADCEIFIRIGREKGVVQALKTLDIVRTLRKSPLFDENYYIGNRPDILQAGIGAEAHYILYGASEGANPSAAFNSFGYLDLYSDVKAQGLNPLWHYIKWGKAEQRRIIPAAYADHTLPFGFSSEYPDDLYAVRPDDVVFDEIKRGEAFLKRYGLLTAAPDFGEALLALKPAPSNIDEARLNSSNPIDVSIIVPVFGQLGYTLNCLDSLLRHKSCFRFEIVVVDDCSQDETAALLSSFPNIRYVRMACNSGFIASANAGAGLATGRFIVMLNNDTRVAEHWLDELIGAFDLFPNAGLVGSKLFFPTGELQEAGGILWQDGSAWNYGRGDDPGKPSYCFARRVDYISGAAIALPADLWRRLDGFDPHYTPAYCEDSDLAFRVRQSGREVLYQPLSRVIHYEGRTSGTDLTRGVKAYQVENQVKLQARWARQLKLHRPNGQDPLFERERHVEKRALVLDATTPTPDQDAGSVTTTKIITLFQLLGYKVTFAPISNFLYQKDYTGKLQRNGVECLYAPYDLKLEEHLAEFGRHYDVIHVFRHYVLRSVAPLIEKHCPGAKVIINNMDLHYLRLERELEIGGAPNAAKTIAAAKTLELSAMEAADVVCVPSTVELDLLKTEGFPRPVLVMPFMVDGAHPTTPWSLRKEVVFLGGFDHTPNRDAVRWFVESVWPIARPKLPADARLRIVGAKPPPDIEAFAGDDVEVTGRIPDLHPVFEGARVFVAPIRYGAGVKGKIFSAFAHGVPVVTTSVGAEGMGLQNGAECLIADGAASFAEALVKTYHDEVLWTHLSGRGLDYIEAKAGLGAGVLAMTQALALAENAVLNRARAS